MCCVLHLQFERVCVQKMIMMFLAWRTDLERGIKSEDHQLETPMRLQKIAVKTSFYYQFPFILALVKIISQKKNSFSTYRSLCVIFIRYIFQIPKGYLTAARIQKV